MLLALDTSTLTLSLALLDRTPQGPVVREALLEGPPMRQSERLPGVIHELLERQGVKLSSLEGIAVGLGPGSFTGLRIGLACAKALAYAARVPLCGASSLAAVAMEGPQDTLLFATAVARVNDLYIGTYRREGEALREVEPERALSPTELAALLQTNPKAVALGPAIAEYGPALVTAGAQAEQLRPELGRVPLAEWVARLAKVPTHFDAQTVFSLEPHYVRTSGAERNPQFPPLPGPAPQARLKDE